MKVIISYASDGVSIDGKNVVIPNFLTQFPNIHAAEWDSVTGIGEIEFRDLHLGHVNEKFIDTERFTHAIALWNTHKPVVPVPTLAELRAISWFEIKQKRAEIKHGGLFVASKWFHSDEESRSQYATMLASMSTMSLPDAYVFSANWKTMDGTKVAMTAALVKQIIVYGMQAEDANYANAEAHRVAMEASSTPETYDFSTGWTSIYIAA